MTNAERFNLSRVFETLASEVPDRECLVWGDRRFTYADVARRSRRLGAALASRDFGVTQPRSSLAGHESGQDHLAICLYNSNEYLEGLLGAFAARVAPLNVNYRYTGDELTYLLTDSAPGVLMYHTSLGPALAPVLDAVPSVRLLIHVVDDPDVEPLEGSVEYESFLSEGRDEGPGLDLDPDDLYILYTGGTTGMPKGVLWTQHDIFLAAMGGRKVGTWDVVGSYDEVRTRLRESGRLRLGLLPPFMHGAAQWAAFMLMAQGATIVLPTNTKRLDPDDVLATIEREHVNSLTVVGDAMVRPLLDALERSREAAPPGYDLSSLLAFGNGGAPLTPSVRARALSLLPHIMISDSAGSTETGAQMHTASNDPESVGRFEPGPGTSVVDETLTSILAPGHDGIGWLAQSGPMPLGYLGDPEKSARTFPTIEGRRWSIPGDRARLLADGTVELLGRDAVTVNSGGEKIFVEEVERALARHPGVADVVVVGRPSEHWGQEVVAIVALEDSATPDPAALVETASHHIARYKLPKAVLYVDTVVRSPSGKADYRWAAARAPEAGAL